MKVFCILSIFAVMASCQPERICKKVGRDPELTDGYYQGDMVMDLERNGIRHKIYKWPNNTVYYYINDHFDADHKDYILLGMQNIEAVSCIRFQEATADQMYYVNITGLPSGCHSSVGFLSRVQSYNLQIYPLDSGCFCIGTIMHEFLHTLGFVHMQSASNRDEFVHIAEENIQPDYLRNFNKYDEKDVDDFGEEYDYGSVLHYSAYAFSVNGNMTIVPLKDIPSVAVMGQRDELSQGDIKKLNKMYDCSLEA